jgi:nucleotide-binding universal stress UspA family protein
MKILAALDFGDSSLEALRQARALAHAVGGTLGVCHVLPRLHDLAALFPEGSLSGGADEANENAAARKALEEHARTKLGLELTDVFIGRGAPYAEVVKYADVWRADVIVVGSHERGALARVVLGSVAERVVRHAHCSVLIARTASQRGVVLVASDFSEPSMAAIAAGAEAAKRNGARLVVVSVLEWDDGLSNSVFGMLGSLTALPPPELREQVRQAMRATIEQAIAGVGAAGESRVLDGSPASAIIDCAEELGAELVVVGTHGRTGLARIALGSVAEAVIAGASCSVLAVRLSPTG